VPIRDEALSTKDYSQSRGTFVTVALVAGALLAFAANSLLGGRP
jgi:hypothetical protein